MRARILGTIALAVAIGLAACSAPSPREFGKPDQDAIRQLIQSFVAAYNAKDLEKVGSFFTGNSMIMPANRSTLRGVDLVKTYYDERFKMGATDLQIEPHDVSGHGPLAYVTGTFSLSIKPPDGAVPTRDRGKVLWIVRDYNGKWLFEVQIMSSDLPPAIQAPAVAQPDARKQG